MRGDVVQMAIVPLNEHFVNIYKVCHSIGLNNIIITIIKY